MAEQPPTRREVLQKAIYVAPMILTLPAFLSFASAGSREDAYRKDKGKIKDKLSERFNDKHKDKPRKQWR